MSECLAVRRDGGVLRLTIDREAKRNALSAELLAALTAELRRPAAADRVIVITGSGERVFCSGADLAVMASDATGLERHDARGLLTELLLAMRSCPLPIVARVQGLCLAGGVALILGCDLVVASSEASFGLPEVNLGLWPFIVSALLGRHVSPKHAMDLMLTGERIDARTAWQLGLVSRVYPAESYAADVEALLGELAGKAPLAVRLGKAAFTAGLEASLPAALAAMQAQLSLLTTTQDAAEGIAAFFAKRDPEWTGR